MPETDNESNSVQSTGETDHENPASPAEGSAVSAEGTAESFAEQPEVTSDQTHEEDLPPVEPPSAGFIMQLFLVPGLIVAAVIAVWALFGKLSTSEQDWRQLVAEVRSNNEHRRWRGATGLAQMLRADVELGESGQQLSSNPQVAKELASLLTELLNEPAQDEELTSQQSFLIRTLGWMDALEEVEPVLLTATDEKFETIVRSDALRSIALIAGRTSDAGKPLERAELTERLLEVSSDSDPLIRQVSAFTIGLLPGEQVDQRLRVLTEDRDPNTCINAALAMARRKMPEAIPALLGMLESASAPVTPESIPGENDMEKLVNARSQANVNQVVLDNCLKAIRDLAGSLTPEQKFQAVGLCKPLAADSENMRIRVEAEKTLQSLE